MIASTTTSKPRLTSSIEACFHSFSLYISIINNLLKLASIFGNLYISTSISGNLYIWLSSISLTLLILFRLSFGHHQVSPWYQLVELWSRIERRSWKKIKEIGRSRSLGPTRRTRPPFSLGATVPIPPPDVPYPRPTLIPINTDKVT